MTPPQPEPKTYPPHDCRELLKTHFHNQDDAQYATCGVCGRITAFSWKSSEPRAETEPGRPAGCVASGQQPPKPGIGGTFPPELREKAKEIQRRWLNDPDWEATGSWGAQSGELLNRYIAEGLAAAHARGREEGLEEAAQMALNLSWYSGFEIEAAIRALSGPRT